MRASHRGHPALSQSNRRNLHMPLGRPTREVSLRGRRTKQSMRFKSALHPARQHEIAPQEYSIPTAVGTSAALASLTRDDTLAYFVDLHNCSLMQAQWHVSARLRIGYAWVGCKTPRALLPETSQLHWRYVPCRTKRTLDCPLLWRLTSPTALNTSFSP